MLKKLEHRLPESESYWVNYGNVLYQLKKYKEAGAALKKAQHFSSNPEHYFVSGSCQEKLGEYLLAESDYRTARFLQPGKFKYRMALMRVYLKVKNRSAAAMVARDILKLEPKIQSAEVSKYKNMAKVVLNNLESSGIQNITPPLKPLATIKLSL
jgi:tetratricopeptide (TPR) repeat protein